MSSVGYEVEGVTVHISAHAQCRLFILIGSFGSWDRQYIDARHQYPNRMTLSHNCLLHWLKFCGKTHWFSTLRQSPVASKEVPELRERHHACTPGNCARVQFRRSHAISSLAQYFQERFIDQAMCRSIYCMRKHVRRFKLKPSPQAVPGWVRWMKQCRYS